MNIGSFTSFNADTTTHSTDTDDERERRDMEARRRIARKAAELRRVERKAEVDGVDMLQRSRPPRPISDALALARSVTKIAIEGVEPEAGKTERGKAPALQQAAALTGERNEAAVSSLARDAGEPAPISPRLSSAWKDLGEIALAIETLREGSEHGRRVADELQDGFEPLVRIAPRMGGAGELPAAPRGGEAPAGECERLEAQLAFCEGFHADAFDDPEERELLQAAIARLRAALKPVAVAASPAGTKLQGSKAPTATASPLHEHEAAVEAAGDHDQRLDWLATVACDALAAGVPAEALLARLTAEAPLRSLVTAAGQLASRVAAPGAARTRASAAPQSDAAAMFQALRVAAERLAPGDERKARLESLLNAQGTDEAEAADAVQRERTQQRLIDARRAGDSLPLAALRAL